MLVQTQFRTVSLGGLKPSVIYQGLDYTATLAVMDLYDIIPEEKRAVFEDIRTMEGAAIKVLNGAGDE